MTCEVFLRLSFFPSAVNLTPWRYCPSRSADFMSVFFCLIFSFSRVFVDFLFPVEERDEVVLGPS